MPPSHRADRIAELERVLALSPDDPDLRRAYGVLLFRDRRFTDAAKQFAQWVRDAGESDKAQASLYLARALFRIGLLDHAQTAAEMAASDDAMLPAASRVLKAVVRQRSRAPDLGDDETSVALAPLEGDAGYQSADHGLLADDPVAIDPSELRAPLLEKRRPWPHRVAASAGTLSNSAVDGIIDFLNLERALIVRSVLTQTAKSPFDPFRVGMLFVIMVSFHVIFFYAVGKTFAGQISYLNATVAPFYIWNCFSQAKVRASPFMASAVYNKSLNIKWIHLLIADVTWDLIRVVVAAALVLLLGRLLMSSTLTGPFRFPNIPLLVGTTAVATFLGVGLGIALNSLEERWKLLVAADHVVKWLMFVTCGLYESYVTLPSIVSPFFKLNPMLSVVEYCRQSLDGAYPIGDLSLVYPICFAGCAIAVGLSLRKLEHGEAAIA